MVLYYEKGMGQIASIRPTQFYIENQSSQLFLVEKCHKKNITFQVNIREKQV